MVFVTGGGSHYVKERIYKASGIFRKYSFNDSKKSWDMNKNLWKNTGRKLMYFVDQAHVPFCMIRHRIYCTDTYQAASHTRESQM